MLTRRSEMRELREVMRLDREVCGFRKNRTSVSLSPGQLAQFAHGCLVDFHSAMISALSGSVKRDGVRVLRMLSPSSVIRWALWTRRSRMASAIVG